MRNNVKFERRHYEFIAKMLRDMPDHSASLRAAKSSAIAAFADALRSIVAATERT